MGTDIHLVAEVKDEHGRWQLIPGPIVDCWRCDGEGVISIANSGHYRKEWLEENLGKPCDTCANEFECWADEFGQPTPNESYVGIPGKRRDDWYGDRNYNVFAIIGDVRNGSGFAGCKTSDGFEVVGSDELGFGQRGLPDDMSDDAYLWFRHHGGDHSDSWLGLDEILAFDWDQINTADGCVDAEQFKIFVEKGAPDEWSGDVGGGSVRHVSNDEMARLIANGADLTHVYTRVRWGRTYRDCTGNFLERMKMLAVTCGEHPARLVFNFDS